VTSSLVLVVSLKFTCSYSSLVVLVLVVVVLVVVVVVVVVVAVLIHASTLGYLLIL
jgi:hypothetical protein